MGFEEVGVTAAQVVGDVDNGMDVECSADSGREMAGREEERADTPAQQARVRDIFSHKTIPWLLNILASTVIKHIRGGGC